MCRLKWWKGVPNYRTNSGELQLTVTEPASGKVLSSAWGQPGDVGSIPTTLTRRKHTAIFRKFLLKIVSSGFETTVSWTLNVSCKFNITRRAYVLVGRITVNAVFSARGGTGRPACLGTYLSAFRGNPLCRTSLIRWKLSYPVFCLTKWLKVLLAPLGQDNMLIPSQCYKIAASSPWVGAY